MRVAILPTGRTEWEGLACALTRLFPAHEFYSIPTLSEVYSNPNQFPYDGFTSTALTEAMMLSPPESARRLVARAAQEALGDRKSPAADLVLIVDDVELPNMEHPERVVRVMQQAVHNHLRELAHTQHQPRTQSVLREKVSFHLVKPMIEAWFFADDHALKRAGVADITVVQFQQETDPENFITRDRAYLAATEAHCPCWAGLPSSRKRNCRPKWLGSLSRQHHPKGYLQWLCIDPQGRTCTRYSETKGGGRALANIDWNRLIKRNQAHCYYLRALLEDLADGLQCQPAVPIQTPFTTVPTSQCRAPIDAVLRNI